MKIRCRVVNKGMAGEPEELVFQNPETTQIIEPSSITRVFQNNEYRSPSIEDDIHYILAHMGHMCDIELNDGAHNHHTLILE